ncbi:MAG: hypothetical protein WED05_01190 [Candidatus Atabeyarchaeum deiterrae]
MVDRRLKAATRELASLRRRANFHVHDKKAIDRKRRIIHRLRLLKAKSAIEA